MRISGKTVHVTANLLAANENCHGDISHTIT
jgi:hypothetical protein